MERVLQQKLHSPAARGFSYVIGAKGLKDALKGYEDRPKYQRLVINFEKGEDPDDAYSEVPYEKGCNFLLHLGMYCGFSIYSVSADIYLAQSGHWAVWTSSYPIYTTMLTHSRGRVSPLNSGRPISMHTLRRMVEPQRSKR